MLANKSNRLTIHWEALSREGTESADLRAEGWTDVSDTCFCGLRVLENAGPKGVNVDTILCGACIPADLVCSVLLFHVSYSACVSTLGQCLISASCTRHVFRPSTRLKCLLLHAPKCDIAYWFVLTKVRQPFSNGEKGASDFQVTIQFFGEYFFECLVVVCCTPSKNPRVRHGCSYFFARFDGGYSGWFYQQFNAISRFLHTYKRIWWVSKFQTQHSISLWRSVRERPLSLHIYPHENLYWPVPV